jgi:hypothetical protein
LPKRFYNLILVSESVDLLKAVVDMEMMFGTLKASFLHD